MIDNSGFLSDEGELSQISASFTEVEILGRSDFNVYGRANRFGKRWFFKGVSPEAPDEAAVRERLLKEFDILTGLDYTGVVRVVSFERIEEMGECIVMEWIEGETLETLLEGGSLSRSERSRLLTEILDAVRYIHSRGIVHRDLKPSNIMVRKNGGSAVIVDFGFADTDFHLYQKLPAGTEGYASDRQHVAHTPYTGDDIHALGVIIKQLSPELSKIARQSTGGRFPSAEALKEAISRCQRHRRRLSRIAVGGGFLVFLAPLLLYVFSLREKSETLETRIETMADSVAYLRSVSQETGDQLRDSLTKVSQNLETERSRRHDREARAQEIERLKENLNRRLDAAFIRFRERENPASADNLSLVRLIDELTKVKKEFFARDVKLSLSDSELIEIELSFVLRYNEILNQWNQTLSKSRPQPSVD